MPDAPAAGTGCVGVDAQGRTVLAELEAGAASLADVGRTTGIPAAPLSVVVQRLEHLGYLTGSGIWQRQVSLSDKGRALLAGEDRGE